MKTKILIITDVSLFSNIFIPLFRNQCTQCQIDVCDTVFKIDTLFNQNDYDFVLVDGGIAQLSCFEAIQHIHLTYQYNGPIWFFPEILTEDYIQKSKIMGATLIIPKPFDPLQVISDYFKLDSIASIY